MDIQTHIDKFSAMESVPSPLDPTRKPGKYILCYKRVSTTKQVEEGHSLEAQHKYIEEYITNNKLVGHVEFFQDQAISGKDMKNRPDFQRMKDTMRKGDTIVSYSLSRLGRNTREML